MRICSVVSKQNAMKAIWDSDLIKIKSTVSNIYKIASKNVCLCSFHMKAIWVSDLIETYKLC